ncbi:MAG: bifunctional acetate--CoA ligase family protein/GNAT family N-acetyltransferase [Candidatus Competibacteraceae bacterium]|nr:bifunctional acetate--CoA ligase family protein/GNAT family N-acetyltransferase [Candidatus Competibacteraceae bacterium]MCP5127333.1 bifunctional acetate--CoA ligase family protein/GNAT family N-acetyltransferase [Gammaproteobacteria bacterium]HRX69875.1 bifunctional acetate--CoA ligase family protein/GNAT family N-acetyltransferase [Candidatus Competibacteraceae bacterium]
MTIHHLDALFKPDAIALICGEGDREVMIARNLMKGGFKGPVMPVDATRWALEGALTYPDIASLPAPPALAIITQPLQQAPGLIEQLGARGARAVLLISDQRSVIASERKRLSQAMLNAAKPYGLRILGPGSHGFNVPLSQLNVSLSHQPLLPGEIAFITESDTIGQTALDIGNHYGFGFSYLIHLGDSLDVDLADLLDYLAGDYRTRAILLYLEQIRDARKFMSAARRAARLKPVIVLKPRRYPEEPDDAVYAAAFRRAGLLRVEDSDELLQMVEVLKAAKQVNNDRLAIVSNSSSMSLLATDTLYRFDGRLAQLSEVTQQGLEALIESSALPNPVDLGDQATVQAYQQALDLLLADPGVDGILAIKTPSAFSETAPLAEVLIECLSHSRCCLIASFPGPQTGEQARRVLLKRQVPTYETASAAVQAFMRIVQYKRNQALLMETPPSLPEAFAPDISAARAIIHRALAEGRRRLDECEAAQLLKAYGIPMVDTRLAHTPEEAAEIAALLTPPVFLKIFSPDIPHKSLVGGMTGYLNTPGVVRDAAIAMLDRLRQAAPTARFGGFVLQPMVARDGAYELTLGVRSGERFGPVIFFGQGGAEVAAIDDLAYGLPPLNMHLAREIMAQTRIYQRLRYSLLRRANLNALALALVKLSQMVIDLGELATLDINPLWSNAQGIMALDVRVDVAPAGGDPAQRLAIRPYPKELEETVCLPDGQELLLRPVLPEDEPALQALVARASPEDLRRRFFQPIRELSHEMAATLTQIDYHREMALVAVGPGLPGKAEIHGIVNLSTDPNQDRAEYSIIVDRIMIGLGLGNRLMRRIISYARARGISEIYGEVLQENKPMLQLNRALGFAIRSDPDDPGLKHVILKLHEVGMSAG